MAAKNFVKKKINENMKYELLNSLREKDEDIDIDEEIKTLNNLTEAIEIINYHENIIKSHHKRVTQYIYKQGRF